MTHFADADGDHAFDAGETLLAGFAYAYNVDGTRRGEADADGQGHATTVGWTYDGEGRLAGETFDGFDDAGVALAYTDAFTYDVSGNKVGLTHDDRTAGGAGSAGADFASADRYDADDRLVSEVKNSVDNAQDSYTAYGYAGTDQTSQTVHSGLTSGGAVTQTTTYGYDATGAMTSATVAIAGGTTTTATYRYDAGGIRVERTQGGQTTVYLVDPSNMTGYAQVLEEGVDANGDGRLDASEVQRAYTLGMTVLAQATATQVVRLLADAHGSTRAALNAGATTLNAAAVLQRYVYSAYGSDLGLSSTPLTAVRYAGQMIDALTGLSYNRARWYSAATGRFTQLDTYGGDQGDPATLNKYAYGNGDPVDHVDPNGHESLAELLSVASIDSVVGNLQQRYNNLKASTEVARDFVRIAFLEMFLLSQQAFSSNIERGLQAVYYGYEEVLFEKRYKNKGVQSVSRDARLTSDIPKLAKYVATLPGVAEKLNASGVKSAALSRSFLGLGADDAKITAFIPLTGSYTTDRVLSWGAWLVENNGDLIASIAKSAAAGDWIGGAYSAAETALNSNWSVIQQVFKVKLNPFTAAAGGYNWHHSEILGIVQLVDNETHREGHTGGTFFWEVLHGQDYRS